MYGPALAQRLLACGLLEASLLVRLDLRFDGCACLGVLLLLCGAERADRVDQRRLVRKSMDCTTSALGFSLFDHFFGFELLPDGVHVLVRVPV